MHIDLAAFSSFYRLGAGLLVLPLRPSLSCGVQDVAVPSLAVAFT
mgnify:CR=1 FL=1